MDPVPPNPRLSNSMYPSSSATPSHSRKRSRSESFGADAYVWNPSTEKAGPSNTPEYGGTDTVMSSDNTTIPAHKVTGLINDSSNGSPEIGTLSSGELNKRSEHSEDAEDRRKFQRQEPSEHLNQDPGVAHDPMALDLGIGWKSIGDDPDRQAAARGWANFIQQHYSIGAVKILAQGTGNVSILAEACGRFYVFYGDLRYGAFVAVSWSECIEEFRSNPYLEFESGRIIRALDSPEASGHRRPAIHEVR
ncbi:MAG: hypothetical protein Q9188_005855 [Gyalolechia gomerana]